MKNLKETKKITLATLKSFAKRNENNIFAKTTSKFDGMIDCVSNNENAEFKKTSLLTNESSKFNINYYNVSKIIGINCVGGSRDYFKIYEDENFYGIEVYNCCGNTILAIKK